MLFFENKKWNMIKRGSNNLISTYEVLNKSNIVLGMNLQFYMGLLLEGKKLFSLILDLLINI